MSKKEAYRKVNAELKKNEERNGGPINQNIDGQLKLIVMELGKANEHLMKASLYKTDPDKFKAYFVGFKNDLAKLAARTVAALDYMERNFDEEGQPVEKQDS